MNYSRFFFTALCLLSHLIPMTGDSQVLYTETSDTSEFKYYPRRIENMSTFIDLDSNNAEFYIKRSLLYYKLKDYEKAIRDDNSLLRILGENQSAYCNRGMSHCFLGDSSSALSDLKRAIELNPEIAVNHLNIGFIYLYFEEFNQAIPHLNRTIELDSNYAKAYYYLGYAYLMLNNISTSKNNLLKAIQLAPIAADAYYNLGVLEYNEAEYEKAIFHLNYALIMNTRFENRKQLFVIRGKSYDKIGDKEKANSDVKKAETLRDEP